MGVAEFGLKYSREGRYQAGGFNLGRVHDPVYAAVREGGDNLPRLEITGTTDSRCEFPIGDVSAQLWYHLDSTVLAIITRSTCDMTLQSRALCTCTADCTSSAQRLKVSLRLCAASELVILTL